MSPYAACLNASLFSKYTLLTSLQISQVHHEAEVHAYGMEMEIKSGIKRKFHYIRFNNQYPVAESFINAVDYGCHPDMVKMQSLP
jgi:hypothetical protein